MSDIMNYLISFSAILVFALISSYLYQRTFSLNIFLVSGAIGIAIAVWIPCIPNYSLTISALMLAGVIYNKGDFD